MAHPQNQRKPTFFWQGLLILLPVAALALSGLFSLRQDRLLAGQEAKDLGSSIAERLAQAIGDETSRRLTDYREVNFSLRAHRTSDLGLSQWAGGGSRKRRRLPCNISKTWGQANPGVDLSAMPLSDCALSAGDEVSLPSYPKFYPSAPPPPEWLQQLTLEQEHLWESANECRFVSRDYPATQAALEKFIDAKPPKGARANAEYLLLLAKAHGMPAGKAAAQFAESSWNNSDQLTDGGLPVGQLICYQALHHNDARQRGNIGQTAACHGLGD